MLDLFGQIPVTFDDLETWVRAVAPAYASSERSIQHYIRHWHVADKVAAAKRAGTFDATISRAIDRRTQLSRRFGFHP
ncbi:hypothetical protein RVV79_003827 [Burkholderia contaminans]|nr:hypothetical protein [Burkholderia contaminans]